MTTFDNATKRYMHRKLIYRTCPRFSLPEAGSSRPFLLFVYFHINLNLEVQFWTKMRISFRDQMLDKPAVIPLTVTSLVILLATIGWYIRRRWTLRSTSGPISH